MIFGKKQYEVQTIKPGVIEIADKKERYSLFIDPTVQEPRYNNIIFQTHPKDSSQAHTFITGRNFEEYIINLRDLEINPELQYLEVGAGLGEFMPHLIKNHGSYLKKKPIVIDPANYEVMDKMLDYAINMDFSAAIKNKLNILKQRGNIITNPKNVYLINSTLEEAMRKYPLLIQSSDVVIDHAAAVLHMNSADRAIELEKKLLSINGKLVALVLSIQREEE